MDQFSFFSNFMGGGGGGHHFHQHEEEDEEDIETEKLYEILGVTKSATQVEIKKAYRKKARELHPDRHPDEREKFQELFQDVQAAHDILKDAKKRSIYDKCGRKAAQRGVPTRKGGGGLLSQLINQQMPETHGHKQSPSIKKVMQITLEEFCMHNKN